jgi:hypothetical protein
VGSPWACERLGATPWHRGGTVRCGQAGLSSRYTLSSVATTQVCAAWCSWCSGLLVLDGQRWLQLLDDDDTDIQLQLPSFLFNGRRQTREDKDDGVVVRGAGSWTAAAAWPRAVARARPPHGGIGARKGQSKRWRPRPPAPPSPCSSPSSLMAVAAACKKGKETYGEQLRQRPPRCSPSSPPSTLPLNWWRCDGLGLPPWLRRRIEERGCGRFYRGKLWLAERLGVRAHGHAGHIWRAGARCGAGRGAADLCSSRGASTVTGRRKGNSPPG